MDDAAVLGGVPADVEADSLERRRTLDQTWRETLPVLSSGTLALREVELSDAASLVTLLTAPEVTRFISPPPPTLDGFERFIAASRRVRADGEGACFAVTLQGLDQAIGIFQIRHPSPLEPRAPQLARSSDTAEWGFAIGSPFWSTGVFARGAALVLEFVFGRLGVRRLEARCALKNGRGGQALLKVGAVAEGVLRNAFVSGNQQMDQILYAILEADWRACRDKASAVALSVVVH